MALTDQVAALATRTAQEIKAVRASLGGFGGPVSTQTTSGAVTVNCNTNSAHAVSATASVTSVTISGTPFDGQRVLVEFYASAGSRTITSAQTNLTPRTFPITVASGASILVGYYYSARTGWQIAGIGMP